MSEAQMSKEAMEALTSAKSGDLKKKINAASWNPHMENLMKSWGEKSAGLRFMHANASDYWKGFSNKLTLASIAITTLSSGASLIAASIQDEEVKNVVLYAVGGIGVIASTLQSIKKFYNGEEKSAEHGAMAKQFGYFYRYITLQMTLSREDRLPSDQLAEYALKEFERMQQDALPLGDKQIALYKKTFAQSKQATPDVCEDSFNIKIYDRMEEASRDDLDVRSVTSD
jgi:hypothetical protein